MESAVEEKECIEGEGEELSKLMPFWSVIDDNNSEQGESRMKTSRLALNNKVEKRQMKIIT